MKQSKFIWKRFRNAKMANKIKILLLPSVIIISLIIGAIMLALFNYYTTKENREGVEIGLNSINARISQHSKNLNDTTANFAKFQYTIDTLKQHDASIKQEYINNYITTTDYDFIAILDTQGNMIANTNTEKVNTDITYPSLATVTSAIAGTQKTDIEVTPDFKLAITSAAPIYDGDVMLGIVFQGYNLANEKFIEGLDIKNKIDVTIFADAERINTSIMKSGAKIIGTKVDSTVYTILSSGKQSKYITSLPINGVKYNVSYMPIKDSSGKFLGITFAGAPVQDLVYINLIAFSTWLALTILLVALTTFVVSHLAVRSVSKPINELVDISKRVALGEVDYEVEDKTIYKDEIGNLKESFIEMMEFTRENADCISQVSNGNFDFEIEKRSENDIIAISIERLKNEVKKLNDEINIISEAAINGDLSLRADTQKYQGEFKNIISGINGLIEAIVEPISVGINELSSLADGNRSNPIENNFKGLYSNFIDSVNQLGYSIEELINQTLSLEEAAKNGNLSYRANSNKLKGTSKEIIDGFNDVLDNIVKPVNEAEKVLAEIAEGRLDAKVEGDYIGDYAIIKNSINSTVDNLSTYIGEIKRVMDEVASGNLAVKFNFDFKGEFELLKNSLVESLNSFNNTLVEINNASDQVASGARQVSDAGQSLSQGATEQAGSIEELSASISEIAAETSNNAIIAKQSNALGKATIEGAIDSNEKMNEMLVAMNEINDSSKNIYKIIKVIDDIAFQTNILALNAAVEAARAGKYGKGFAVVAEEVRNLAERSAAAAKETTGMIETSIDKVEEGSEKAHETATRLKKIIENIEKSAELIGKISNSTDEQATAIAQINKGIDQVSQVTQTNSATAEESAAASEELSSQAEFLKQLVGKFRLNAINDKTDNKTYGFVKSEKNKSSDENKVSLYSNDVEFGKY